MERLELQILLNVLVISSEKIGINNLECRRTVLVFMAELEDLDIAGQGGGRVVPNREAGFEGR